MENQILHLAEFVSPGHPDRLADAIAEGMVDHAVAQDERALVGVEVAVHTNQVFVDGRTQLYSAEFWRSTYLCDDATRAPTLAAVRADAAVLPVGDSVFRAALVELGWTSAYRDQRAEVMLPPNGGSANANQ